MANVRSSFQQGFAKLIAQSVNHRTRLTHVSNRAPTRLLPLTGSSLLEQSGKAQCALSNYGGGMVHGDESIVTLQVDEGAQLGVTTQGPNRIYKSSSSAGSSRAAATDAALLGAQPPLACKTVITATIANDGFLVLAPDPTVLFANSNYDQITELRLASQETSSCIAMDWFAAGRVQNGEEWSLNSFSTTTKLYYDNLEHPILVDRIRLPPSRSSDTVADSRTTHFWGTQAFCSVVLAGPKALPVVRQLQAWSSHLTSALTRVRNPDETYILPLASLGRNVIVSVSEVQSEQVYVARIAAQSNEDIYRVLYNSLLSLDFGVPFYKDRVASGATLSRTPPVTAVTPKKEDDSGVAQVLSRQPEIMDPPHPSHSAMLDMTDENLWSAFVLMDSSLPTGSFAHSAGMEVAQQFGFLAG